MGRSGLSRVRGDRADPRPLVERKIPAARYPIRAVSSLTGIGIDTLRAWERRHGAVSPLRDHRGRLYSDADIARLRLLRGAVERGHSIGQIAGLTDTDLDNLAASTEGSAVHKPGLAGAASLNCAALGTALAAYDAQRIDQEIARLSTVLRPLELLQDVLMPALASVGTDWHLGRAGIAHEHLMSSAIRHALGSFLRLYTQPDVPSRLLFATPSGDRHEIGTLGAAMLAASSGLGVTYLGPDIPGRDILQSLEPAGARVLVMGLTAAPAGKVTEREMRTIVHELPRSVELWVGGPAAGRYAATIGERGRIFQDYASYRRELVRVGGRAA